VAQNRFAATRRHAFVTDAQRWRQWLPEFVLLGVIWGSSFLFMRMDISSVWQLVYCLVEGKRSVVDIAALFTVARAGSALATTLATHFADGRG
jgi:hypothetical protein